MKTKIAKLKLKFFGHGNTLQGKTLTAAFWSLLGSGGRGAIRFISNLALTRLLFPEAFGLIATAMVVITLVQVFSDTGAKTALIQNPRGGERRFVDTSFILGLIRSLVLFTAIVLAIDPVVAFYNEPALKSVLLIMSFALLAEGFINPALPLLIKNMRLEKQVSYAIGSQFAGFMTTLALVYLLRSVEALAYGYLATSLFRVLGSYLVTPYLPHLKWDREAGRELFHFGKFIIVNTLIGWAVLNIDRLVIGKVLDMEQLAYYNIALYLGVYVSEVLVQIFAQSYFPAVSSIAHDVARVQAVYKKTLSMLVSLVAPPMMLLVLFAQEMVDILYDPRYALAGGILFWISLKSYVHFIAHLQSGTLTALGKPGYVTVSNGAGLVLVAVFLPMMTREYGLQGAGIIMLVSSVLVGLLQSILMVSRLKFSMEIILRPWIHLMLIAGTMTLIFFLLSSVKVLATGHFIFLLIPMLLCSAGIAVVSLNPGYSLKLARNLTGMLR